MPWARAIASITVIHNIAASGISDLGINYINQPITVTCNSWKFAPTGLPAVATNPVRDNKIANRCLSVCICGFILLESFR
jgi:hypothetical protein